MVRPASIAALTLLSLWLPPRGARAQTFDAYKQFKLHHNPNGPWSYLAGGTILTGKLVNCASVTGYNCWWNKGSEPNSAIVGAAEKHASVSYDTIVLPADYIALDPEDVGDATVEWTAPSAGQAVIAGNFLGVDTNEASHSVAVLHNGTALKTFTISAYKQKSKFHLSVTVAVGDTITFSSYTPNAYSYLTTGLQAKITLQ